MGRKRLGAANCSSTSWRKTLRVEEDNFVVGKDAVGFGLPDLTRRPQVVLPDNVFLDNVSLDNVLR
jgi:hypothetical protein